MDTRKASEVASCEACGLKTTHTPDCRLRHADIRDFEAEVSFSVDGSGDERDTFALKVSARNWEGATIAASCQAIRAYRRARQLFKTGTAVIRLKSEDGSKTYWVAQTETGSFDVMEVFSKMRGAS